MEFPYVPCLFIISLLLPPTRELPIHSTTWCHCSQVIRSHLRASVWFSCDLLLVNPSTYITILVPLPSLSVGEDHLTVFIGGNKDQSSSIKPRLRFVSVGSFLENSACDEMAQIKAMAEELPDVLGQMLSQSPSADGFLRRPSMSFVDVRISSL